MSCVDVNAGVGGRSWAVVFLSRPVSASLFLKTELMSDRLRLLRLTD